MNAISLVHEGRVRELAVGAATCAAGAALVSAMTAAAIAVASAGDDARLTLQFDFAGLERTAGEALGIAAHNARLAGGMLLCALVAPHVPRNTRGIVNLLLATVLVVNAAVIGVALGAYGTRLPAAAALHLPVELAALSLAGGAYVSASRRPFHAREFVCVAALCAVLIVIAAVLETYAPLGGVR